MDFETAMDIETNVSIVRAMDELEKHYKECFVMDEELYAGDNCADAERVCIVYKGMVKSRTLLRWLGY